MPHIWKWCYAAGRGPVAGAEHKTTTARMTGHLLNEAVLHVNVGIKGLVIVHNPAALDQQPVALEGEKTWRVRGKWHINTTPQRRPGGRAVFS